LTFFDKVIADFLT